MYQPAFINPHKQFGKQNYELVLTDDAGVLPTIRQWMSFPEDVKDSELFEAAEDYITHVLDTQLAELTSQEVQVA